MVAEILKVISFGLVAVSSFVVGSVSESADAPGIPWASVLFSTSLLAALLPTFFISLPLFGSSSENYKDSYYAVNGLFSVKK